MWNIWRLNGEYVYIYIILYICGTSLEQYRKYMEHIWNILNEDVPRTVFLNDWEDWVTAEAMRVGLMSSPCAEDFNRCSSL